MMEMAGFDATGATLQARLDFLNGSLAEAEERAPQVEEARRLQHQRHVAALHRMVAQVEGALSKVHDGTYGKCDSCNQDIPAHELAHEPAGVLCAACRGHEAGPG